MYELLSLGLLVFVGYIIIEARKIEEVKQAAKPKSTMRKIRGKKSLRQVSISPKVKAYYKQKHEQIKSRKRLQND